MIVRFRRLPVSIKLLFQFCPSFHHGVFPLPGSRSSLLAKASASGRSERPFGCMSLEMGPRLFAAVASAASVLLLLLLALVLLLLCATIVVAAVAVAPFAALSCM